uniref:JAZF zinc finger 1 n=1 Tax=Bos mutus grunniens TaxID=30521 RepID=A0A8B9W9L6_BOSMU
DKVGGRRSQVRPQSRGGGWGRTAVAARPGPSSQLRRLHPTPTLPPPLPTPPPPPLCLPVSSRNPSIALAPSPSVPSSPLPSPASLPSPAPPLLTPPCLPPSLRPPARRSLSRHQGGSRCSTMTGIAAASFFSNTCRFGGCGLHFPTLADLIEHIEDNHIVPIRLEIVSKRYVALSLCLLNIWGLGCVGLAGPPLTGELLSVRNWGKHPASKSMEIKKQC